MNFELLAERKLSKHNTAYHPQYGHQIRDALVV